MTTDTTQALAPPQINTSDRPRSSGAEGTTSTSASTSRASSPTATNPAMRAHETRFCTDRALTDAFKAALTAAHVKKKGDIPDVVAAFHDALNEHLHRDAPLLDTYRELTRAARIVTNDAAGTLSPRSRGSRAVDRDLAQMLQNGMSFRESAGSTEVPKAIAKFAGRVPAGVQARRSAKERRQQLYQKRQAATLRKALEKRLGYRDEGESQEPVELTMGSAD